MTAKTRKAKFKRIQRAQVRALRVKQRSDHAQLQTMLSLDDLNPFIELGATRQSFLAAETLDYAGMKTPELRSIAQARGIRVDGKRPSLLTKDVLVETLTADDQRQHAMAMTPTR